jgi:hypothetical protein
MQIELFKALAGGAGNMKKKDRDYFLDKLK